MNDTVSLITILGAIILGILVLKYSNPKDEQIESSNPERPKKSVKLLTKKGVLLYEYRDVFLTHWDKSIYCLSYEYKGKSFLRIDKGADMLLLAESYIDTQDEEQE